MLKVQNLKRIIVVGLFICCIQIAHAGIFPFNQRISTSPGSPVTTGTTTTVQVSPLLPSGAFYDRAVMDKITLGVDHSNMDYFIPASGTIAVVLKIDRWDINGALMTALSPVTLTLNYQPFSDSVQYLDKTVYNFTGAYSYKITIQSITENGVIVPNLQKNLFIDADILLERYTDYSTDANSPISFTTTQQIDLDCDSKNDELQINWTTIPSAEEYQLEWTFVNDYGTTPGVYLPVTSSVLEYDFRNNSTRITTAATTYKITLAFEHGYLLYRVRGIGRDLTDPSKSIVGVWSEPNEFGSVNSFTNKYHNTQEHEADKNWQYSATYAEEGKKKEVVSYFDGSLRNRQSVTKVNSDNNTIVGETIYDHQGRPAINALPVPVQDPACTSGTSESSIKYYPGFNKVDATTAYTRVNFDLDASPTDSCHPVIYGMDPSNGASNYYSSSNPNKNGIQAFVPDAEKFPFTQVEYTNDNTGRIRRQSGVGPDFQLGSNHETKYFYGWPNQIQLDRMFGSEVGNASHYKKNLVIDANGQVSVSYLDQEGRTIATSLAGDAPKDATGTTTILAPLESESGAMKPLTIDLFAKDADGISDVNSVNVQHDAIVFNSQLLVAYKSDYEFNYDLKIDTLYDPCLKDNICFNCVYDLEIKVTDDCGRIVAPMSGSNLPIKKTVGHFTADASGNVVSFNTVCTSPTEFNMSEAFTLNLPVGNYTVSKILTINSAAKDFYVKTYFDTVNVDSTHLGQFVNIKDGCILTYQSFLDTALAHMDTASCNVTCEDCAKSLQTINGVYYPNENEARDAYVSAGYGTDLDFDFRLEDCGSPCKEISVCEATYEMLLMDVSPDGQYAQFQPNANGDAPDLNLSVLYTNNILPKSVAGMNANWKNPKIKIHGTDYPYYLEEDGTRSTIHLSIVDDLLPIAANNFVPAISSILPSNLKYDAAGDFYYTYPENLANVVDFVHNWTDNWAKSLVQYHPEYCYYESCSQYGIKPAGAAMTSDAFDILLQKTETFNEAVTAGLITGTSMTFGADPFSTNSTLVGKIAQFQYYAPTTTYYSMTEMAAIAARCGTQYGSLPASGSPCTMFGSTAATPTLDQEWNLLKNFYLSAKQTIQQQMADDVAINGCNAYNGCIGNSSYNPFTSGMMYYSTGSGFSSYFYSPFHNPLAPCGAYYASYYFNKKKRFNPQSNEATPSAADMEYQVYLQTGQCPIVSHLQYLLTTLASEQKLTNTSGEDLQSHPEFTQDLYTAISGGTLPATYTPYTWTATSSSPTDPILSVNISSGTNSCALTLDKTGTGITSWNDVVNIIGLKHLVSGSDYDFTASAAVANPVGSVNEYSYYTIKGTSCIKLTGCTFEEQCEPNDLAVDLSNLWSALFVNSQLTSTNVNLDASATNYKNFITPRIKNALGTINNSLRWNYNSAVPQFELFDNATPAKKLVVKITTFTPGTFSLTSLPGVVAFADIEGDNANGFSMNGVDASYTGIVNIKGTVDLDDSGTITPVSLGECGLPEPILCSGDPYRLRGDLEAWLADALLEKPFDPNFDLTLSPKYTSLLNSYVSPGPGTQLSTNKYDLITLNANGDYKEQIFYNLHCECKIILNHTGSGSQPLLFQDMTGFSGLTGYGPTAFDGNYYHFYAVANYLVSGTTYTDTIYGESCLPLLNCIPSVSNDTVTSPTAPYVNPCYQFQINLAYLNAQNAYQNYIDSLTTEIARKYTEHCLGAFENFTAKYDDKEYHFTLYYYDQAGNLVRTIPPEGVRLVNITAPATLPITTPGTPAEYIALDRKYNRHTFFTDHTMATTYLYNSLNQLVRQYMPDHDLMDVWDFKQPNGLDSRLKVTATQFVNSTKGYLSGFVDLGSEQRGYLYSTDDAGVTWTKMNDVIASDLKKVQMVDASTGYAVGNYGIVLKTTDGGTNWNMLNTYINNVTEPLNDLFFVNATTGVIVGEQGRVLTTSNGGSTFTAITLPVFGSGTTADQNITSITNDGTNYFITVTKPIGSTTDDYGLILTSPTGAAWTAENQIQQLQLNDVSYHTNTHAYAAGLDGSLLFTDNAGASWQVIATGSIKNFRQVYFNNDLSGVALIDSVPGYSQVYKTFDGGKTWALMSSPGRFYNAISEYIAGSSLSKLVAVGKNGLVQRLILQGGTSFGTVNVNAPAAVELKAVWAKDFGGSVFIVAAGSDGKIYSSNNGGIPFITWNSAVSVSAFATDFVRSIKACIVGTGINPAISGTIVTESGKLYSLFKPAGSTTYAVTLFTAPTAANMADVTLDEANNRAFAFDNTSKNAYYIPLTTTATTTATQIATASTITSLANSMVFQNSQLTVVGQNGEISTGVLNSTGTATTGAWQNHTMNTTPLPLTDIQYSGTGGTVYAVGGDGTILQRQSTPSWKTLISETAEDLNAIKFNTATQGLVAGDNGSLWAQNITGNAASLTEITLPTTNDLYDIALNSANKAYIAGAHGTVVSINDITSPVPVLALPQPSSQDFKGICFLPGANSVYAVGDKSAVYSYNGTSTSASGAKIKTVFTPQLNDVHFTNTQNGYAVGEKGTIRFTQNGGVTWSVVLPTLVPNSGIYETAPLNAVFTKQPNLAYIAGNGEYVAQITNSAITSVINPYSSTSSNHINDIAFDYNGLGYTAGNNSLVKTISGGVLSATPIGGITPSSNLNAIHIFNDNSLIVVGTNNGVFTALSGGTFTLKNDGKTGSFNDVFFHDDRNGYIVGNAGKIYRCSMPVNVTTSPGITWTAKSLTDGLGVITGTNDGSVNITSVAFATRYDGFLGGNIVTPLSTTLGADYARLLTDESEIFSTRFWYDRLGRMVVSQNTKQFNRRNLAAQTGKQDYSYTLYDDLGRIEEVGEKTDTTSVNRFANIFGTYINSHYNPNVIDDAKLVAWVNGSTKREVTHTYYDDPFFTLGTQDNLRKRVASVTYKDIVPKGSPALNYSYQHATHYSYDIHGNVKTLWQENKQITIAGQNIKRVDYEYDLISGKVNTVRYQDGQPDAFYHFYEYDADNRITDVYTSSYPQASTVINSKTVEDNPLWDKDGHYIYYAHGPLARVELGDNKVQGIDYAYTLQGWIKGVNSNSLDKTRDIGQDGLAGGIYDPANPDIHKAIAKDAFGYTLNYYQGDYTAIQGLRWSLANNRFEAITAGSDMEAARFDLFNGNITSMGTTITEPKTYTGAVNEVPANVLPQATAYKYDQLNRLLEEQAYANLDIPTNKWLSGSTYANRYHNLFTYDANGNILTQLRADASGNIFDQLSYKYKLDTYGRIAQNRLYQVQDAIGNAVKTDDIDDQDQSGMYGVGHAFDNSTTNVNTTNNYRYDEIGNLIHDEQEGIDKIEWTVYGKIKRITRITGYFKTVGGSPVYPSDLEFNYDASGNRVSKIEKPRTATGIKPASEWITTYYARDAQGNIMTTYKLKPVPGGGGLSSFKVIERNLFGSSRLGTNNTEIELIGTIPVTNIFNRILGNKYYEASNHLGNVLSVITDRKIPMTSDGVTISYYEPDIISSNDYYPFGSVMEGRTFASEKYRYGMNGKEKDDEIKGGGNSYDFGDRMYDPRLGRMLSVDEKANKYSFISPYSFAIDNPINATDPDGKDVYLIIWATANGEIGHAAIAVSNYREVITKTIVNGQEITSTSQVPDGTFTYYDLWPGGGGAGKDNATVDVDGKYYKTDNLTWNGMFNKDPSGGEGRVADGIIKMDTDYETDMNVIQTMENRMADDKPYNGATNNCSDNAECGIEAVMGRNINADEVITTELTATTPNKLYKATEKLPNATVLRSAGSKVDNGFISGAVGYGTVGRKVQAEKNQPAPLAEDNVKANKQPAP